MHSSTSHLSQFVNRFWTRWLPPPGSWEAGHQLPRELCSTACLRTDVGLRERPVLPLGGWHSGSLAVHWGTACSVRSVIFRSMNFWNVIFLLSETWPGSLLRLTQKPALPNFNLLFKNSKSPQHFKVKPKHPLMSAPVFFLAFYLETVGPF